MEQSAYEALIIGVNVFIFVIALSAAIMLMGNVLDMVNYANEIAIVGMNGSLAETVGIVHERIYSGAEMLSYYRQVSDDSNYVFRVKLSQLGSEQNLDTYVKKENIQNYISKQFEMEYKGKIENKDVYVFKLRQD